MDDEKLKRTLDEIKAYALLGAKEMLTVEDVALLTGYKVSYIRKLTNSGQLPYYKPFGKVIYRKSEINAFFLNRNTRVMTINEATK